MGTLRQFMSRAKGCIYKEKVIRALSKAEAKKLPSWSSEVKEEAAPSSRKRKKDANNPGTYSKQSEQAWKKN